MARGRLLAAAALAASAALLLAASSPARSGKEGGTFRVAVLAGFFDTIDPALVRLFTEAFVLEPACGTLMAYPSKRPPAGLEIAPELAADHPVVSKDGRTYTFTIRKDARFSDGKLVTALAFARAIERILDPAMKATLGSDFAELVVGGKDVLDGKTKSLVGLTAKGKTLTLRLTRREPEFSETYIINVCAVPPTLPVDPEGVKAPLPSAGPYYIAQYFPGDRLVLERNRFYKGARIPHVSRYEVDLKANEGSIINDIKSGKVDTGYVTTTAWAERSEELARLYGRNKTQFWVTPGGGLLRMFVLNTSRRLFRNNPKLRQAVNFAVDRKALTRELGGSIAATPMDQYLRLRDEEIYPLTGPDLRTARKLAKGRTRGGKAVLYTRPDAVDVAQAQILRRNLKAIGIEVEVVAEFPGNLIFEKLKTGQKDFDIGRVAWGGPPSLLNSIFDGRTIGTPDNANYSYFNSEKYNRLLRRAALLTGPERYRAYAELDVQISRDAAPAIPVAQQNAIFFVSARTGCIIGRPWLDLTAVCLK